MNAQSTDRKIPREIPTIRPKPRIQGRLGAKISKLEPTAPMMQAAAISRFLP